jgi:hypothetical protein
MKKLIYILLLLPSLLFSQETLQPYEVGDEAARGKLNRNFTSIFTEVDGLRSGDSAFISVLADTLNLSDSVKIYYDPASKTTSRTTGIAGVIVQDGQELHRLVVNNTADTLFNGTPVYASGVDAVLELLEIDSAKASSPLTSLQTLGLVTADIAPGSIGLVTFYGKVRDFTIPSGPGGAIYLAPTGGITATKPLYPNTIILLGAPVKTGANGVVEVAINLFDRPLANKSYSFTTNGINAGTYYLGGFYDAPLADANLTQALTSINHGSAGNAYAAHAFIVSGGVGTVDAGQVGLRVVGNSITDAGVYTASDTAIVTTDITTVALDSMIETPEKFLGTMKFELYDVSGTPTTYSFDFNYGYAKYEDFGNVDFTVSKIEAVGLARLGDIAFDITLLHHKPTGWTYSAAAFDPGNGVIADWTDTMAPDDDLVGGEQFAWKVTGLNQFVHGDADEGIVIKITAGANNAVQSMDVHIIGFVESF